MTARLLSGWADLCIVHRFSQFRENLCRMHRSAHPDSNPIADLFDPNKPIGLEHYPNARAPPDHCSACRCQSIISFRHRLFTSSIIIMEDVIFDSDDDDDINRAIAAIVAHQDDTDASDDDDESWKMPYDADNVRGSLQFHGARRNWKQFLDQMCASRVI